MAINYLNNKTLYEEMLKWKKSNNKSIPDTVARAIIQICNNLAKSGNFSGYTWKDEMIQDAILVCTQFANNFNPEITKNPFAYFTQIAYNAFRRRIIIENNRLAILEYYKQEIDCIYDINENSNDEDYNYIDNNVKMYNYNYQKTYKNKKSKNQKYKKMDELFSSEE